jgi:hypothetical protein
MEDMRRGMTGGWPSRTERLGLRCLRVGFDVDADAVIALEDEGVVKDADAEWEIILG